SNSVAVGSGAFRGSFSEASHLRALTVPIYLGYRLNFTDAFSLAAEASFDLSQNRQQEEIYYPATTAITFTSIERTLRHAYRFDLIPSYQLCSGTYLYLRAGYAGAQFYARNTGIGSDPAVFPSMAIVYNLKGYDIGGGMQSQLYNQWFYRVQYIH